MRGRRFQISDRGNDFAMRAHMIMHNNQDAEIQMENEATKWE